MSPAEFAAAIVERNPGITVNRVGNLKLNNAPINILSLLFDCGKPVPTERPPGFLEDIEKAIRQRLKPEKTAGEIYAELDSILIAGWRKFSELDLFQDSRKGRLLYLAAKDGSKVDKTEYRSEVDAVRRQVSKEACDVFCASIKPVIVTYLPRTVRTIIHPKKGLLLNLWTKPDWMPAPDYVPTKNPGLLPQLFDTFLQKMIPKDESRNWVLGWMRDSLFEKALQICAFKTVPGVGKNLFHGIMKGLHGAHNSGSLPSSFNKGAFDSAVANKTYCFADEFNMDEDGKNKMKRFLNEYAQLEEKHQNVDLEVRLHASFMTATNNAESLPITMDDRKWSTPECRHSKLSTVMDADQIRRLVAWCDADNDQGPEGFRYNPEFFKDIYDWLYFNVPAKSTHGDELRNTWRFHLCLENTKPHVQRLVAACKSHAEVSSHFFQRKLKIETPQLEEIRNAYRKHCGEDFFEIIDDGQRWIVKSLIYEGPKE